MEDRRTGDEGERMRGERREKEEKGEERRGIGEAQERMRRRVLEKKRRG